MGAAPLTLAPWDVLGSGTEGQQGQASRSKAQKPGIVPQPGNSWGRPSPLGLPFVWAEALKATDISPGPFPFMTPQAVSGLEARPLRGCYTVLWVPLSPQPTGAPSSPPEFGQGGYRPGGVPGLSPAGMQTELIIMPPAPEPGRLSCKTPAQERGP